jgi:hypothetical protein
VTLRAVLGGALACAGVLAAIDATEARAQQYLLGASGLASSGIDGGGADGVMNRARTRLRLGGDVRIDESPDDIFEFGFDAEIEPKSAFGADLRYARATGRHFVLDAGVIGFVAPASLYGALAGVSYHLPLSANLSLVLGPEADFFFLGSDLPDGGVLWEVRIQGGLHVSL